MKKENLVKKLSELKLQLQEAQVIKKDFAYLNRFMCYASLPHSDTGELSYRRTIEFGAKTVQVYIHSEFGVPYGILPRRMMAFLLQQAVRNKTNVIHIGNNQTQFLNNMGVMASYGKRGYLKAVKEQAKRLLNSYISVRCDTEDSWEFSNSVFAEKGSILWHEDVKKPWSGEIHLSMPLFNDIIKNGVPIEMCAVKSIQSSLAFDIYLWLRWKLHHLKKDTYISWKQLFQQFGFGYQDTPRGRLNFKKNFLEYLRRFYFLKDIAFLSDKNKILFFAPK